jgi:outer membrane immunogenic protein
MRKLMLGATALALPIAVAHVSPAAAAPPVPYSWTGFYIGAHAGYGIGETNFSGNADIAPLGGSVPVGMGTGFFGGGQLGYNYQVAPHWVVGAEGNLSWSGIMGRIEDPFFSGKNLSSRTNWIASATGRVGYTGGDFMFYGKGGAAWLGNQYAVTGGISDANAYANETRLGYTVGGGIEWAVSSALTARIEFNYYGLGSHDVVFGGTIAGPPPIIRQNIETFEVGINYHFGMN